MSDMLLFISCAVVAFVIVISIWNIIETNTKRQLSFKAEGQMIEAILKVEKYKTSGNKEAFRDAYKEMSKLESEIAKIPSINPKIIKLARHYLADNINLIYTKG